MPIQLVEMQLTGSDPILGPLELRVRQGASPSVGDSTSLQSDGTYRASSFFDVFFELDVLGATLHNNVALPVVAVDRDGQDGIRNTPPDPETAYRTPGGQGSSDCCVAHLTAGCSDLDCENAICLVDTFCCSTQWAPTTPTPPFR